VEIPLIFSMVGLRDSHTWVTDTADLVDDGVGVGVDVGLGAVLELLHPLATPTISSPAPSATSRFMSFARLSFCGCAVCEPMRSSMPDETVLQAQA